MDFEPISFPPYRSFDRLRICYSPALVKRTVARVPGGYMNRWLVRAEVEEPTMFVHLDTRTIYCNPQLGQLVHKRYRGIVRD